MKRASQATGATSTNYQQQTTNPLPTLSGVNSGENKASAAAQGNADDTRNSSANVQPVHPALWFQYAMGVLTILLTVAIVYFARGRCE